jgi:Ca2+-binding RTX toxin-like protein
MAVVNGTSEADVLLGTDDNDQLYGLESDDRLYGGAGSDLLEGGPGNDWLWGGAGADHFVGGDGFDTVSYSDSLEGVRVEDFTNYDGLTIAYGDTFTGIEAIQGSNFDDVIYRHQGSMTVDGAAGYDTVNYRFAFESVNVLIGGDAVNAEGDTLRNVEKVIGTSGVDHFTVNVAGVTAAGGYGDDIYTINSAGVTVEEDGDFRGGTDHLYTSLSVMRLDPFIENLTYTGTADFTGYGNDESNTIVSGIGNDVLYGRAGGDNFEGGAGLDIVSYDDSTEGLSASLSWGPQSGIALYDVYIDIEGLRGSQFNDSLEGNSDDNILEGGAGDDQIRGGDGNDHIYGGLASGLDAQGQSDTLSGGAGNDVIIAASNDLFTWASGDDGNDVITLGSGVAFGGQGDDLLIFNSSGQTPFSISAYGEYGNDTYEVNTTGLVTIRDDGLDINDTLILNTIANASQLNVTRVGNDAYLHSANDGNTGVPDNGVKLLDWYAGFNTIEHIQTADGQVYDLPTSGDAFAMFG